MTFNPFLAALAGGLLGLAGCGAPLSSASTPDAALAVPDAAMSTNLCPLLDHTTATSVANPAGCHVLSRDSSACLPSRQAAGLGGGWLRFSCRVTLTKQADGTVQAATDDQPDYQSMYFPMASPCYAAEPGGVHNPSEIGAQKLVVNFPAHPDTASQTMRGTAVVGLALNGVAIYGNFAAPGDDIFMEAVSFDRCGAHPQDRGQYHYHAEPYAISDDDANFIGMMRDGYPIYGRRDQDGSLPSLDATGGHNGVTAESERVPVYHYHLNQQTSLSPRTQGQKQWFLTTGTFRGTPAPCAGCN